MIRFRRLPTAKTVSLLFCSFRVQLYAFTVEKMSNSTLIQWP